MPSGTPTYFSLNTDKDNDVIDLYVKQRVTGRKIAEMYDVPKSVIYKVLDRNGVERKKTYTVIDGCKVCTKCNVEKTLTHFGKNKNYYKSWCNECRKTELKYPETVAQWKENNKEKVLASWRRKTIRRKNNPVQYLHTKIRCSIHDCIAAKKHKKNKTFQILGYTPYDLKEHLENLFIDGMSWENKGKWHIDHIRPLASFGFNSEEDIKTAWALENLQPLWASDNIRKSSHYENKKHNYIKQ